jgi:hypothetical protein
LKSTELWWLLLPQMAACIPILSIWNPFGKRVWNYQPTNLYTDRATLFWWSWRDLAQCEFGVGALLVAAPLIAMWTRQVWLLRASVALGVYVSVITIVSPQPVGLGDVADIRYLAPTIPLCIAIGVMTLRAIGQGMGFSVLPLAILAFWTSLLWGGRNWEGRQCSTLAEYIHELAYPPSDTYTVAANWINLNVAHGRSIYVIPYYMAYPLMYHAPHAVYAWQFRFPPAPQFRGLAPIHYSGLIPPDYVIAFGPDARQRLEKIHFPGGAHYDRVAKLEFFWRQMHRPELFWHAFRTIREFDRDGESILIFQKLDATQPPTLTRDRREPAPD